LKEHRRGLEAVARALLENETVDGSEIARLVDEAYGRPVHGAEGKPGSEAERYAPSLTGGSASPIVPPPAHDETAQMPVTRPEPAWTPPASRPGGPPPPPSMPPGPSQDGPEQPSD
jgi:hypothetical protein